jgi:DNA-binding XRE family transcriptional regulator
MLKRKTLPSAVEQAVQGLGEGIRLARVRRRMSQEELAQASQITRKTLYALEKGVPGVSVGTLFSVLWALGMLDSAKPLADPDQDDHGKILEKARQPKRVRRPAAVGDDF